MLFHLFVSLFPCFLFCTLHLGKMGGNPPSQSTEVDRKRERERERGVRISILTKK